MGMNCSGTVGYGITNSFIFKRATIEMYNKVKQNTLLRVKEVLAKHTDFLSIPIDPYYKPIIEDFHNTLKEVENYLSVIEDAKKEKQLNRQRNTK